MKKILIILLVFLLAVITACHQFVKNDVKEGEKAVIKIGYLPLTHAVPLFLQHDQQYEDYTLELVKFGSWPELMDALNTGAIDGASVLMQLAMNAKEKGIDLKAVALGHRDGNALIGAMNIQNIQDLKGKNFGIPSRFSTHNVLLNEMLKANGMTYSDIKAIELPPAEMPAALSEGRIAGYVVAEPFGAISVALGKGKVLAQSEDIWKDSIDCGLVLRQQFIDKHHDLAKTFVKDYVIAGQEANEKDVHAEDIIKQYVKVEDNVLDLSLKWISYDNLAIEKESYDILRNASLELGISKNPPTYEQFVDNSLLP